MGDLMMLGFGRPNLTVLVLVVVCLQLPQFGHCEDVIFQPLDPDVVKVWVEDGATAGWIRVHRGLGFFTFRAKRTEIEEFEESDSAMGFTQSVPAFQLPLENEVKSLRLPTPKAPFALALTGYRTVAELEELIGKLEESGAAEHVVMLDISRAVKTLPYDINKDHNQQRYLGMTQEHLQIVSRLKNLKALSLHWCFSPERGTEGALKGLASSQNLVYLDLSRNTIYGLNGVSALKRLQGVNLRWVNGMRARWLKDLDTLEELKWLSFTPYGPIEPNELERDLLNDCKVVATLEHLECLVIGGRGIRIDDQAVAELAKLSKLRTLECRPDVIQFGPSHNISDKGLGELGRLTKLTELKINVGRATKEGVQELQRVLPKCEIQVK
jgi:hypothetical protein